MRATSPGTGAAEAAGSSEPYGSEASLRQAQDHWINPGVAAADLPASASGKNESEKTVSSTDRPGDLGWTELGSITVFIGFVGARLWAFSFVG
jgi:hypothetical protein